MKNKIKVSLILGLFGFGVASLAMAQPTIVDLGSAPPPFTLGGNSVVAFPLDLSAEGTILSQVTGPDARILGFPDGKSIDPLSLNNPVDGLTHWKVGSGWLSWANSNYAAKDVYQNFVDNLTLQLPANTKAFYFYVMPASDLSAIVPDYFNFTISSGGVSLTKFISGETGQDGFGYANGFGLFAAAGETLGSVTISNPTDGYDLGFGVGQFGIDGTPTNNVPDGALNALLVGLLFAGLAAFHRRTVKR